MKNKETVNMLLNVDNFYGEHQGRLGPLLRFLAVSATPLVLYAYWGFPVPSWIFWPLWAFIAFRASLVILGREKIRLISFKNQLNDNFSSVFDLLNIKTVHPDGCIEYLNGRVGYMLVCYNGTSTDDIARTFNLREFCNLIVGGFDFDIYVQNITEVRGLEERYKHVKLFVEPEAARDFIDIIDHNRRIVYASSLLTRTIYLIKGTRSDWKEIHENMVTGLNSPHAKAFKHCFIADRAMVEKVTSRDVNTVINFEDLIQRKYSTHEYFGSKVLYFDEPKHDPSKEVPVNTQGFMRKYEKEVI